METNANEETEELTLEQNIFTAIECTEGGRQSVTNAVMFFVDQALKSAEARGGEKVAAAVEDFKWSGTRLHNGVIFIDDPAEMQKELIAAAQSALSKIKEGGV